MTQESDATTGKIAMRTTVRRRLLGLLVAGACLFAAAAIVVGVHERRSVEESAVAAHEDTDLLIRKIVDLKGARLDGFVGDYSYWDELVAFVKNPRPEWSKVNLEPAAATYQFSGAWVYGLDAKEIYAVPKSDAVTLVALPFDARDLKTIFRDKPLAHFFVVKDDQLIEVRAATIHISDDEERVGERFGYLIGARAWDETWVSEIADVTSSLITIHFDEQSIDLGGADTYALEFAGWDGAPVATVRLDRPDPAVARVHRAIAVSSSLFLGFVAVVIATLSWALWRWVSRPLRSITEALDHRNADPLAEVAAGADEFAAIGRLMQDFFAQKAELEREIDVRIETERQLVIARRRAEAAALAKAAFLANMSHEIRTPMNGVIGMTEILTGTALDAEQRDCLDTVRASAEQMLTIVNDILDISKIEAGKFRIEAIDFNLRGSFDDVGRILGPMAFEKGVEFQVVVPPDVPEWVKGDPTRLRQIVTNLAGNAVKFTEKGEISIEVGAYRRTAEGCALRIVVRDTGIGIAPDRLSALFQEYEQAEDSTARRFGGTGLGLAISKKLVELMGGKIEVESTVGKGTSFSFEIPFGTGRAPEQSPLPSLDKKRILVVDDNSLARRVIAAYLSRAGASVECAVDLSSAIAMAEWAAADGRPIELGFIDLRLNGESGIDVAQELKARPAMAGASFVLVTGGAIPEDRSKLAEAGFSAAMVKPVRQRETVEVAYRVLSKSKLEAADVRKVAVPKDDLPNFAGVRILVADDNVVNLKVATLMLAKLGCEIATVANGREALDAHRRTPFDLILMDCHMPEMDGYEATRAIRDLEKEGLLPKVPVIALTAAAMEGDRERCLEADMNDYLSKPVRAPDVAKMLERWAPSRSGA